MRNDDRHRAKLQRQRLQLEGITVAEFERADESELLAHTDRQHAAMHEHGRWIRARRREREDLTDALVLQRVAVTCGIKTNAAQTGLERVTRAIDGVIGERIEHEETDEARRM